MNHYVSFITVFLFGLCGTLIGDQIKDSIIVRVGDSAAKTHESLCVRFEKIASGGFFSTSKNNREVTSTSSGYCKQYRIRKGDQSLIFVTAQKDGRIVSLASTQADSPLEYDAIPWVKETQAKIDLNRMQIIWSTPKSDDTKSIKK